jgi:hypothetical protein
LRFKEVISIDLKDDFESYSKSILLKLEYFFRNDGFHTSRKNKRFEFKRFYKTKTHYSEIKRFAVFILREGLIDFEEIENKKIKVTYWVSLDYTIFLSLIIAILVGLMVGVTDKDILFSILISILTFLGFSLIGFIRIQIRMKNIIEQSI